MIVKVYFERRKYESWYTKELNYENSIVLQSLKQASPKAIDAENQKVDRHREGVFGEPAETSPKD